MENRYCCNREMRLIFYGSGGGEILEFYECVVNNNHREFKSELERKVLKYVEKIESRM